jgi:thiol-disulfide isomerase/thioredoxin
LTRRAAALWLVLGLCFSVGARADAAPDFDLPTDQGRAQLKNLHGKVVYLDFWATWCVPCRTSFPWMNEMQARYADRGLVVVAVNVDKDATLIKPFLADYPAKFTVAYDPIGTVPELYHVQGMPSSFLIDRNGAIQMHHTGFRDKDRAELEAKIQSVLGR